MGVNPMWTERSDVNLDTSNWAIKSENEAVKTRSRTRGMLVHLSMPVELKPRWPTALSGS